MSCCLCTFGSKQASMNKDAEPVVRPDKQRADHFYIRRTGHRPNKKKPAKFHWSCIRCTYRPNLGSGKQETGKLCTLVPSVIRHQKKKRARVVAECRTCITWQGNKGGPARDQRV